MILEWIAGLWASYGLIVLVRIIYGLSMGRLQASPNDVSELFVPVLIHLGIPVIALILIRREHKQ